MRLSEEEFGAIIQRKQGRAVLVRTKAKTEAARLEPLTGDAPLFLVGIDPGVETGVAMFHLATQTWKLYTIDFHGLMDFADQLKADGLAAHTMFVVENASSLPVYRNKYGDKSKGSGEAQARSIGANNREAQLVIGELRRRGLRVVEYVPRSTFKNPIKKWTAAECRAITGYAGQTNQHVRDAMRFVWDHRGRVL